MKQGLGEQLLNFSNALQQAMGSAIPPAVSLQAGIQAFTFLTEFLKNKTDRENKQLYCFDEFPHGFIPPSLDSCQLFGHWWNTWASQQPRLKVVICGSAASWMIENIIKQ